MSASSPRWRFQIHLSTALALTFMAGLMIWANVTWRVVRNTHWNATVTKDTGKYDAVVHGYGRPFVAFERIALVRVADDDRVVHVEFDEHLWDTWMIVADAGIAAVLLVVIAVIFELSIRQAHPIKAP